MSKYDKSFFSVHLIFLCAVKLIYAIIHLLLFFLSSSVFVLQRVMIIVCICYFELPLIIFILFHFHMECKSIDIGCSFDENKQGRKT